MIPPDHFSSDKYIILPFYVAHVEVNSFNVDHIRMLFNYVWK